MYIHTYTHNTHLITLYTPFIHPIYATAAWCIGTQ
jgi:hypothetical protein